MEVIEVLAAYWMPIFLTGLAVAVVLRTYEG
jgi:hypothetical protein